MIPALGLLSACAGTTAPDPARIDIRPPDAEITKPCEWTEDMPETTNGDEQERVAIRNRLIGDECKMRHDALRKYVEGLTGAFRK